MLEAFLDQLQSVKTLNDLDTVILSLSDELNVEHVVYHSVSSSGKEYAATTYNPKWVDQYLGNDYARIDPVVQACVRRFKPVDWKRLNWSGKSTKNFLGEAIDAGVGNQGFSVPIRGPSGQFVQLDGAPPVSGDDRPFGKRCLFGVDAYDFITTIKGHFLGGINSVRVGQNWHTLADHQKGQ